ncbi:nuclear pore complex protein Nup205 [Aplysia californica]|uniref:Nuclear pore complex protein Nup205 n=1 Tax=Aplysia californica TaxID=6500 RepID=A0ABM1VY98_APLCA|nr:nuclear pore complex protein Nup205 [Aplysia californica]
MMGDTGMAVNLGARVWMPFRELNGIVETAVTKRQPGAVHDLEMALRKHKPDFISLLKRPAKNTTHRDLVKKSTTEGIVVQGEQRKQTFTQQFVAEALILSDVFDLNELAAVELLMAGEVQLPNYPGLTRGLVAVLLFYDGQRSLVSALRALAQAREGRTWTVGVTPEIQTLINDFVDQLLQGGLVGSILDLIKSMVIVKEMDKLQKDRALGPPKHRKQVTDLYTEIRQTLADTIFCLACQRPLNRQDTLRLLAYLRQESSLGGDETLDKVNLSLLQALWYCFDVSLLQKEDSEEVLSLLPVLSDQNYMQEVHQELVSAQTWGIPGLKAAAQFGWAIMLRQISQFNVGNGGAGSSDCCEDDERLIDLALEGSVFYFLSNSVVACQNFHTEEFYLRRLHGLISDFIYQMPLKTKELRNRGDEMSRIILAHQAEGLEPPVQRGDLHEFMTFIGDLYIKDPLKLQLALEYWCPPEATPGAADTSAVFRPDPKQIALFKFVRVAGDLLPAPLFLPYLHMLTGLATGPQCAHHCFSLLRVNGGQANPVSWDHIFHSIHQYYSSLRQEAYSVSDTQAVPYRASAVRSMTPQELEAVCSVLKLTRHIAVLNETCRSAFCENQQWSVVMVLFGLLGCSVTVQMKGELMRTLAAISQTPVFAATIWQTLEASQILPTTVASGEQPGGFRVELEEVESRNEEYPLTRGFLELMGSLTLFPVPMGLGAGTRSPGFDPYLDFILNSILLKYNTRAYKSAEEKWQLVCGSLEVLVKLLTDYELQSQDLQQDTVDVPGLGIVPASKQPGFTVLCLLLSDSKLFKTVQMILEEAVAMFEQFAPFPGDSYLERAALLCLQLLEGATDRQGALETRVRETASPLMISGLERLLLAINPRTRKADYLVNITKFVVFNTTLPKHTLSAVKILCHVCRETPSHSDIINLFTAEKRVSAELLQGFVECLDSNTAELAEERASALLSEPESDSESGEPLVQNSICEHIIQLMLVSLDLAAPNLAHWLLGFHLQKPVIRTTLQDPGVLESPKTCLHSVLTLLEQGLGSREGPTCLLDRPRLAELGYHLIYALCANKDTSPPTLRYLRTTHDFLFKQLQHLPLDSGKYANDVSDHQAWLLKTAAIELRMTSLNHQRSHTQRLVRLLLGDEDQELHNGGLPGDDGELSVVDRESSLSLTLSQANLTTGKQMRHRILGTLDTISFEHFFPPPLQFTFFDKSQVETLVRSLERKTPEGVSYCDVRALRHILLTELANQQGPMVAGQRPHIMEEIQLILETVVEHNESRQGLQRKKLAFEAWRQLVEVMLTTVPQELLDGERRQSVLFDLLQELLVKVSGEEVSLEATALVSDVLLTLMANLRHCFSTTSAPSSASAGDGSAHPFWTGKGGSSRTAFSTSLQVVLRGLIDYILKSSGGIQKVKVNLYGALLYCLQIAAKPNSEEDSVTLSRKSGMEKLLGPDIAEFERLAQENMETIGAYGDSLMETLCRDACDGHHVGRMLALSVLDSIISTDSQRAWLGFLCGRGYLQHLVDSLASEDDSQLLALLSPQPANLRPLYIFQSKMSLLTRIAESAEGARVLLHGGALEKLAACSVLSLRPEVDDGFGELPDEDENDLFPSPLARYRQLLFVVLRFCLALLTSLGGENKEAATQVMLLIISHGDVFTSILRSRKPALSEAYLRELSLTTAVIARANYHSDLGADLMENDTASMEFRSQRMRLQDQMLALLPHFSMPETLVKQLNIRLTAPGMSSQAGTDETAEVLQLFQEVASNLTAYCRSLIANIGSSSLNQHLLFGPSLEEVTVREGHKTSEVSVTLGVGRRLGLGVVLLLLQQCSRQFSIVLEQHHQLSQKLTALAELSVEDLRKLCGDSSIEKLSSQQRQGLARSRLVHVLAQKSRQLQHYVYIVENCLYIIWRHLEFFLVHCVPADQGHMTMPTLLRHQTGIRRLTGALDSSLNSSVVGSPLVASGLSQVALGVSRADVEHMRSTAPIVLNEAFFKKVQTVDQCFGKERSHYSFSEAIARRIKRVLKLHTGK